jgi:hypothetical protein
MKLPRYTRSRAYGYAMHATLAGFVAYLISKDVAFASLMVGVWGLNVAAHGTRSVVDASKGQQMNKETGKVEKVE